MYVYIHVCRPAGQAVIPVTVIRPSAEPTYALSVRVRPAALHCRGLGTAQCRHDMTCFALYCKWGKQAVASCCFALGLLGTAQCKLFFYLRTSQLLTLIVLCRAVFLFLSDSSHLRLIGAEILLKPAINCLYIEQNHPVPSGEKRGIIKGPE